MDDKQIQAALQSMAEHEIGDDMNLWPHIETQVRRLNRQPRMLPRTRFGWVTAILLLFITAGATAYAVDRLLQRGDPGLDAVELTYLNQTQTIGNLDVTLQYAYADANRISLAYSVRTEGTGTEIYGFTDAVLTDDAGHTFEAMFGGGGGSDSATMVIQNEGSYDASIIEGSPTELNLRLELTVGTYRLETMPTSGEGGGGGSAETPQPPTMLVPTGEEAGTAVFEFTIPFNPGRVMDTTQTVSASGIEMTLQRVVVTPSLTRLEICYEPPFAPPARQNWNVDARLEIDGELVQERASLMIADMMKLYAENPVLPGRCRDYLVTLPLHERTGQWTFSIDRLRLEGSTDTEAMNAVLVNEYNIELVPQPGGGFGYSQPDDMPYEEFWQIMERVMAEHQEGVDGPWVFSFDVD